MGTQIPSLTQKQIPTAVPFPSLASFESKIHQARKYGKPNAILFDLDGTLVKLNTNYSTMRVELRKIANEAGYTNITFERIIDDIGRLPGDLRIRCRDIVKKFEIGGLEGMKEVYGARTALEITKDCGAKTAIVSRNHYDVIDIALNNYNMSEFIDLIIAREHTVEQKPHPQPIIYALSELHIKPDWAIMFGDSLIDEKAAGAAGIRFIGVGDMYKVNICDAVKSLFYPEIVAAQQQAQLQAQMQNSQEQRVA